MTAENIICALKALIDEEHTALVEGRIEMLEGLGQRKLTLLEEVVALGNPLDDAAWSEIRKQNARNGTLYQAALRGLQESRARIELIRSGGVGLKTYDRQGRAIEHTGIPSLLGKRA